MGHKITFNEKIPSKNIRKILTHAANIKNFEIPKR